MKKTLVLVSLGVISVLLFTAAVTDINSHYPGGITLSGTTNLLTDSGSALQRNGVDIAGSGGGGGVVGTVITNGSSISVGDIAAFGVGSTNILKASGAQITNAMGFRPVNAAGDTMGSLAVTSETNTSLTVNRVVTVTSGSRLANTTFGASSLVAGDGSGLGTNGMAGQIGAQGTNGNLTIFTQQSAGNASTVTNWGNLSPYGLPNTGFYSGNPTLVTNYLTTFPVNGKMFVPIPSQFPWDPGFRILRTGTGKFEADWDWNTRFRPPTTWSNYWVDWVNGNDANPGTSPTAPKQTLDSLLVALGGGWPTPGATVWIAAGPMEFGLGGDPIKGNFALICTNGVSISPGFHIGSQYTTSIGVNTWGKVGGFSTNVSVYDFSTQNFWGLPLVLTAVPTTNDCVNTPNSWSTAAGTVTAIHTWNNRQPDTNIVLSSPVIAGLNLNQVPDNNYVYMENITLIGNQANVYKTTTNRLVYAAKNCRYLFNATATSNNFHWNGPGAVYHWQSEASGGQLDGFNYHNLTSPLKLNFVEVDCRAFTNGLAGGGANNGTTSHDGDVGLRVNGVYLGNADRDVHDVNAGTVTWNLGCVAGQGYHVGTTSNQVAWACGLWEDAPDNTRMLLDSCYADRSVTHFASFATNGLILLHNTLTNGAALINGNKFGTYTY